MKTEYKHIEFIDVSDEYPERKTQVWVCQNKDNETLGYVEWFNRWRQYCFNCEDQIILAVSCLNDIANFIDQLHAERKRRKEQISKERMAEVIHNQTLMKARKK